MVILIYFIYRVFLTIGGEIMENTQHIIIEKSSANNNGFAITALVLGLIGVVLNFIPFLPYPISILAIIFGVLGMNKTAKRGMSIAGIVLGVAGILMKVLFWMILGGLASV